ncbi:MAG: class I SAM-dependent methyltransferase, partial [Solirubrobacteraceae bacterium]
RRARERGRRFGVAITPVVADAERLPLRDRAIDLAYVHDGLHHLADPHVGLAEMARVARRAVSITEPAQAAATAIAVRLGLAFEQEEAGNRVSRLDLTDIERRLASDGFRVLHAERYAMFYRQLPGITMHLTSRRRILPWAVGGWRAGNRVLGRLGNKLTVQAVRD